MRNFPWLEAALIIALAVALIVRPQKQEPSENAPAQQSHEAVLGR